MQIKCDYCGEYFSDTEEQCPFCGAPNEQINRTATGVPKTIEELKQFAFDKHIPLEKIRFFIGIDYREPKAFGIYKDEITGNFIVYKNKSDGVRAVRYEGKDEAYAVNEIYQKLREEINNNNERHGSPVHQSTPNSSYQEKNNPYSSSTQSVGDDPERKRNKKKFRRIIIVVVVILALQLALSIGFGIARGASGSGYNGGGTTYYHTYDRDNDNDYDYDSNDSRDSDDDADSGWSSDDSWDSDWDTDSSWDSDWDNFDSDWGSDW